MKVASPNFCGRGGNQARLAQAGARPRMQDALTELEDALSDQLGALESAADADLADAEETPCVRAVAARIESEPLGARIASSGAPIFATVHGWNFPGQISDSGAAV